MVHQQDQPRPLPQESVVPLLELLDVQSLSVFRAVVRLEGLEREARLCQLRKRVLQLLKKTKFPFTHAAYVLGLNGPYFSHDTAAAEHYGMPKMLPPLLCQLFRFQVPGVPFTTVRMQKLNSAANFGGKHRTLAFSLESPTQEDEVGPHGPENGCASTDQESQGYALFLADEAGCQGGRGEVCQDLSHCPWKPLAKPSFQSQWVPFPRSAWLQWHWPQIGEYYVIIVTCEPPLHRRQLALFEQQRMREIGFLLPECGDGSGASARVGDGEAAAEAEAEAEAEDEVSDGVQHRPRRRSVAAVRAARMLLRTTAEASPAEVEEAFRRAVREVHPDTAPAAEPEPRMRGPRGRGWAVAQLTWARKVLQDAADAGMVVEDEEPDQEPAQGELLMLAAP